MRSTHTKDKSITCESYTAPIRLILLTLYQLNPFYLHCMGYIAQGFTASNTALDALKFQKHFDITLFKKMAEETNRYAPQKQETHPDPTWTPTYTEEIKAFIGIHINMGLVRYPTIASFQNYYYKFTCGDPLHACGHSVDTMHMLYSK